MCRCHNLLDDHGRPVRPDPIQGVARRRESRITLFVLWVLFGVAVALMTVVWFLFYRP